MIHFLIGFAVFYVVGGHHRLEQIDQAAFNQRLFHKGTRRVAGQRHAHPSAPLSDKSGRPRENFGFEILFHMDALVLEHFVRIKRQTVSLDQYRHKKFGVGLEKFAPLRRGQTVAAEFLDRVLEAVGVILLRVNQRAVQIKNKRLVFVQIGFHTGAEFHA